ncbi:MAG: ABC transporter ATP-binding protein [Fimbriimonadaceae bacterium]|nr:ABC transporter ATP-binding protein [Alphaproteobacteria bacterium]
MMDPVLSLQNVNTEYGRAHILHGVSLQVGAGEAVALMGRNGAGKSTTLKTITGLVSPRDGHIIYRNMDITGLAPYRIARMGLGYVPEERRIFTDLSVWENLEVGRQPARGQTEPWTPERIFDLFPNLAEMRGRRANAMSGGEQQMLTVARTLMGNPDLILLDEPSEGLAPVIVNQMGRAILQLKKEGLSVLLCEQNLSFASQICDRAYVIEGGEIKFEGTMKTLAEDEDVRRAYLTI